MNKNIFRAYDIRGIAIPKEGEAADLTEDTAYLIGLGAGTYLREKYSARTIAVGRDCRLTSPALQKAYMKGLSESGMEVTDIGLSISPMVYWSIYAKGFDAGTNITASHNPKEYNGLKIVSKVAHSICGEELQLIYNLIMGRDFNKASSPTPIKEANIWPEYLKDLQEKTKISKPLKIVIDAGNGTAGPFAPEFFKSLGCEVVELYCKPDGNFPNHEANPEELENMKDLIAKVLDEKADIGLGFD
ncbi:phosphomannomutase, partial [Candidatus Peregrinibacteria bacterium]|nr:phosphomannomutase [Candidatus Peregrinibacteria bacterium]